MQFGAYPCLQGARADLQRNPNAELATALRVVFATLSENAFAVRVKLTKEYDVAMTSIER